MKPFRSSQGSIFLINVKLLYAVFLGFASYWCWPSSAKWWGFGIISIFAAAATVGLLIQALRDMIKLHARDKVLDEYMALGNKPKSSEIATNDILDKARMR